MIAQRSQIIYATATARAAPRATSEAAQATATSPAPRATISAKETVIAKRSQIIHATATARALSRIPTPTSTSVPLAYGAGPASQVWAPPTAMPQSAGVRPTSAAASASVRPTAAPRPPPRASGPCRLESAANSKWFDEYFSLHAIITSTFENIQDTMSPEGSYSHYNSMEELRDAVQFDADFMRDFADEMFQKDPPPNVPSRVRSEKNKFARAYSEMGSLLYHRLNGDISDASFDKGMDHAIDKVINADNNSHPIIVGVATSDLPCHALE